jgi:radical SAM protein with 4Fe4S-binding SPASM domain
LYKKNYDLVEKTARYAESLGAGSLKLNCISYVERGSRLASENLILSIADYLALKEKIDTIIQPALKIKIILDIPPVFSYFPKTSRHPGRCGIFTILGVLADGRISICGIGASTPALLFGSMKERSLADIWNNEPILKELREGLPHKLEGICGECMFKAYCLGKCRAEAYYMKHSLFAPFSFCNDADRLGLFPEKFKYSRKSVKQAI